MKDGARADRQDEFVEPEIVCGVFVQPGVRILELEDGGGSKDAWGRVV